MHSARSLLAAIGLALIVLVAVLGLAWRAAPGASPDLAEREVAYDRMESYAALGVVAPAEIDAASSRAVTGPADDGAFTLVVRTRTGLMPDSAIVPRVRVLVGVGEPPLAQRNANGQRAGLALDGSCATLAEAVTDEHGSATISIPRAAIEAARTLPGAAVWTRVVEPGLKQRTSSRRIPDAPTSTLETTVIAFPGPTLRGRVVDERGEPVVAYVQSRALDFERKLGTAAICTTASDGWFEVLPWSTDAQTLTADAGDFGTAALAAVDPLAAADESIELVVRGPGVVRGRVVDDAGRPASALDLLVCIPSIDDAHGSMQFPPRELQRAEIDGRGRAHAQVRTDADGAFEARGLRDDLYVVRARTTERGSFRVKLTPDAVPSDGAPLELRLQRTVLAIRVVDDRGEPWTGDVATALKSSSSNRIDADPSSVWPKTTLLVVARAPSTDLADEAQPERLEGRADGRGTYVYPVEDGGRFRVGLVGGTQAWRPVDVDVAPAAGCVEVVVVASREDVRGTLSIVIRDPQGRTVTGACSIRIADVEDGTTLIRDDMTLGGSTPRVHRLPEGRYRVVIRGEAYVDDHHGTVMRPTATGSVEHGVEIVRGQTTDLLAELPVGARIRLKLTGDLSPADSQAVVEAHPPGTTFGGGVELFAARARTFLVRPHRRPIPVIWPWELRGSSGAGTHLGTWVALGDEVTSDPVPSGEYELVARLPGGREARAYVRLVDGVTTEVALAFDPPR